MNKSEMAVKLAKKVSLTHAAAANVVDMIFNAHKGIVAVELDAGRKVTLPGFGTFATRKRGGEAGPQPGHGQGDHDFRPQVRHLQGGQDAQGKAGQVGRSRKEER